MKLVGALLALVLLLGLRRLLRLAEGAPWAVRAAAAAELVLVVGLFAGVVGALAGPAGWTGEGLLVALALVALAGAALGRDYVAGVALRAGGAVAVGDRIRSGDLAGHVTGAGAFRVVLRTETGELTVPWSRLAAQPIERQATDRALQKHAFELAWTDGRSLTEVCELVRRVALLDPLAPTRHPPELEPRGPSRVLVTLTTLEPRAAFELEKEIRRQVGG